jgi:hypothetical protein
MEREALALIAHGSKSLEVEAFGPSSLGRAPALSWRVVTHAMLGDQLARVLVESTKPPQNRNDAPLKPRPAG